MDTLTETYNNLSNNELIHILSNQDKYQNNTMLKQLPYIFIHYLKSYLALKADIGNVIWV